MKKLRITIENKSYEVTVEDLTDSQPYQTPMVPTPAAPNAPTPVQPPRGAAASPKPQLPIDAGAVTSPMAGSIKSVLVKPGDPVKQGQPLVILEAMKMDNQVTAPAVGTVKSVDVAVGESVQEGHVLVVLE
jgi:biotin carboxyl carrier protein